MSDPTTGRYVTDSAVEAEDGPLSGAGEHPLAGRPAGPSDARSDGGHDDVFATGQPAGASTVYATGTADDGPVGDDHSFEGGPTFDDGQVAEAEEAYAVADAALADAEAQRDEYLDSLRRLQADFENYKKRVDKQRSDQFERANEGLVTKLLPVLDTADLAIAHGGGEAVTQLRTQLLEVLVKEGLEPIAADGEAFDPNLHDAVATEPGDGGPQEVAEALRAGYRWNGRVLRPAMVKVRG